MRAETDCAAQSARSDLLLRATWHRFAAGDADLARAQTEVRLARADKDPGYAPTGLARHAGDPVTEIGRWENGDHPTDETLPQRR